MQMCDFYCSCSDDFHVSSFHKNAAAAEEAPPRTASSAVTASHNKYVRFLEKEKSGKRNYFQISSASFVQHGKKKE